MVDHPLTQALHPAPADSPEVADLLIAAQASLAIGDLQDAARSVRQAAERAGDAGDDGRALHLAKVVSSLLPVSSRSTPPGPASSTGTPSQPNQVDSSRLARRSGRSREVLEEPELH